MNRDPRSKKKGLVLALILLALGIAGGALFLLVSDETQTKDMGPIIAGKPTVYWLEHRPHRPNWQPRDSPDPDDPLEKAGPEIIP